MVWIPITLFVLCIGFILSIPIIHDYDINRQNNKRKLNELNTLYECSECKKYHRKYQQYLKEKTDENYLKVKSGGYKFENDKLIELTLTEKLFNDYNNVCPHCLNQVTSKVQEEYKWTKYHQDCPSLDNKKYKTYTETLEYIEKTAYEIRSMNKFMEMNDMK